MLYHATQLLADATSTDADANADTTTYMAAQYCVPHSIDTNTAIATAYSAIATAVVTATVSTT